ncbi:TlpA family protein disulfide reductase [bacterium]|nr:TlpA family protein disulfide reductase [bacterium]MDB4089254.1 TlpA family protein disulfide reductase [Flavobacteriales bacterium]
MSKTIKFSILLALSILVLSFTGGNKKTVPSVNVKNLQGKTINTSTFKNDGKPIVISFWATWCSPCKKELNNIAEVYEDWQEETGVKLIAISIDDARNKHKVKPYVDSKGWDYEVYIDANQDLKRAMNVNNVPYTFLVDVNGKIVYEHNNYVPGDEDELYKKIKMLTK